MSVVVWDGRTLAADCQGTNCDLTYKASKIRRLSDGTILSWTGTEATGEIMARWYEDGADLSKFPACQSNKDDWSRLIAVSPSGKIVSYENYPTPINVLQVPMAWGCGRDFALGAMAMGADARKAVEVASQFSNGCGFGVEAFDLVEFQLLKTGD